MTAQKARFEFFTTENGLTGNSTTSITQDDRGFIWLLNENKLLRFDGRKFLNYPISADLTENGLYFLGLTTYENSLLLLSARQSVLLLNPKNGKWESFPMPERNGQRYVMQEFFFFGPGDILLVSYNLARTKEKTLWRFHKRRIEALSLSAEKTTSSAIYRVIADASGNTYL